MKISATLFLFLFSFVIFAASTENTYVNEIVGIEIAKPKEWFFLTTDAVKENRNRINLDDKHFEQLLKTKARLPLVSISKYKNPETKLDVTPTVNVMYSHLGKLKTFPPDAVLKIICGTMEKQFLDFKYEQTPVKIKLSNKNGAKAIVKYTLENKNGYIFKIRSEIWIIPKGDRALMIAFAGPAEGPDVSKVEFMKISKSIKVK